jgi:hypothetical protein
MEDTSHWERLKVDESGLEGDSSLARGDVKCLTPHSLTRANVYSIIMFCIIMYVCIVRLRQPLWLGC